MIRKQEYIRFDIAEYRRRIIAINTQIAKLKRTKKNIMRRLHDAETRLED